MNNAEVIRGLDMIINGCKVIKTAIVGSMFIPDIADDVKEVAETPEVKTEVAADFKEETSKTAEVQEETPIEKPVETTIGGKTLDEISRMGYNDFKKFAATLGVKCTGTRDAIMERIMSLVADTATEDTSTDTEEAPFEVTEETITETAEEETTGEEISDNEESIDYNAMAEEILNSGEYDVDDIISELAEVGIKATKKNVSAKLALAFEKGLIELDDCSDDNSDEETAEEETTESADTITPTAYFKQYDLGEYNNPDDMTEERKSAVITEMKNIISDYYSGKLTADDMTDFISDSTTEEEQDKLNEYLSDDDDETELLACYMEIKKHFIDNDGNKNEPNEAYELGEHDMCCGHALKYNKKSKTYICEICGEEYEAE